MGDCSSGLFVCPSACNRTGHRNPFSTTFGPSVENVKRRLWSCKGNNVEGIRLLWAVAIGLGAEIHFPLFLACLWKIQREDYGRAREITRKESGCYGRLFQRSFCMPECLQSDWAQESIFHYFWPVCGKRKEKTVILQMEIT